jgi:serine protease Do
MRKSVVILFLVAMCLVLAPGVAVGESSSPSPSEEAGSGLTEEQKLAPYVQPSVVFISVKWEAWLYDKVLERYLNEGQPVSADFRCTGYVVNPNGWIVTAGHCVEYADDVRDALVAAAIAWSATDPVFAEFSDDPDLLEHHFTNSVRYEGQAERDRSPDRTAIASWGATVSGLETEDGKLARVVDLQRFDEGDTALLKVDENDLNALPLIPADETVETLTGIAAVGYGGSVDAVTDDDYVPSIKTGTVSAEKTIGGGLVSVYEIDAAVTKGMSGGPTVTYDGEVVGTNSFGVTGEPQAFNFVAQSDRAHELLNSQGVENELSETTQNYRAGIDAYFAGDKAEAVRLLGLVQEQQPANGLASEYLSLARDLPDPPPPDDGSATLIVAIVAGALVLVAVILAGLWLVRRRSGGQRPASGVASEIYGAPSDGGGPSSVASAGRPVAPSAARAGSGTGVPVAQPPPTDLGGAGTGSLGFVQPGAPALRGGERPGDSVTGRIDTAAPSDGRVGPQFCGECGAEAEGGKFCRACGSALI